MYVLDCLLPWLLFLTAASLMNPFYFQAVYSMANVIPISLLHTGLSDCGELALSFTAIRVGRSLWFSGKYSLVSFEIFVLSASIWTLYYGTRQIPKTAEVCLHLLCIFAGVGSFIGFYFRTIEISLDGYNARTQSEAETNAFSHLSARTLTPPNQDPPIGNN